MRRRVDWGLGLRRAEYFLPYHLTPGTPGSNENPPPRYRLGKNTFLEGFVQCEPVNENHLLLTRMSCSNLDKEKRCPNATGTRRDNAEYSSVVPPPLVLLIRNQRSVSMSQAGKQTPSLGYGTKSLALGAGALFLGGAGEVPFGCSRDEPVIWRRRLLLRF